MRRAPRLVAATALALPSFLAGTGRAGTQEIPEFHQLRSPSAPAFVILGITPAQIERPTTPGAFAASFLQRAEEAGRGLPRSYALELAPYWLRSHPGLGFEEYQQPDWRSLYRDATLSLAITDSVGDGAAAPEGEPSFRRLGVGARATLRAGAVPTRATRCVGRVSAEATRLSAAIGSAVAAEIAAGRLTAADTARMRALQESLLRSEGERLQRSARECTQLLSAREGFAVDGAVAGALTFPGGRARGGEWSAAGLWVTPAWLGESVSHVGVARLLWSGLERDTTTRIIDLGARSIYAWRRFAASLEAVYRMTSRRDTDEDHLRVTTIFDVHLTEETWLTLTFGRDFDPDQQNSLLALLGLRWQVGERRIAPDVPLQ